MSVVCLVDKSHHEDLTALHAHLRRLKIKQVDYYLMYHPRVCLGTGQPIPFKNVAQYLSQEFIDKNAIKRFIKDSPEKGRKWAIEWLRKRKEEKGLVYAPSQVELRSLSCPSMKYYDSVGGYHAITRELGFKDRYTSDLPAKAVDLTDATIIYDTREQLPLKFTAKTVKQRLNHGDYALAIPHDRGIYIERKSLNDFVGTLSARSIERVKSDDTNVARFDRELARTTEQGHYIVMLVEVSIETALEYNDKESPHFVPSMQRSSAGPSHIFKSLRDLLVKYPLNFQAVFVNGRADAAQKALRIFEMGERVKQIDLQYALERGIL